MSRRSRRWRSAGVILKLKLGPKRVAKTRNRRHNIPNIEREHFL